MGPTESETRFDTRLLGRMLATLKLTPTRTGENCLPMASTPLYSINSEESVGPWSIRLRSWSRNPHLLGGMATVILVAALIVAWTKRGPEALATGTRTAALKTELARSSPEFEMVVNRLREIDPGQISSPEVMEALRNSKLSESENAVA